MPIASLVDSIDRRQLRLPEIQRDYVWKPAQIAGLLKSLYLDYPSGSILLWETDDEVTERRGQVEPSGARSMGRTVQYFLDGQQRLTSLHRVFHDPERTKVVFNVEDERFQIESAATARDARWVRVHRVLHEQDLFGLTESLAEQIPGGDRRTIGRRLGRLQGIAGYLYHVEIISNLGYDEVADIFIRVNSKGRALETTDLALATLSARWHGVMTELEDERDHWKQTGFPGFDLAFLARCIAATATPSRSLDGFRETDTDDLRAGWLATKRGTRHLARLLENNAGIETSTLIPSANALVPLIAFLGVRPDEPLSTDDADALLYWLFSAFLTGRYSQSGDSRIAEDAKAVRESDPIPSLYPEPRAAGWSPGGHRAEPGGPGAGSPFFLLSYLTARRAGATDWWYAIRIGLDAEGGSAIEYHHIHPQATLRTTYAKAEINDLANLAFISARANKRVSNGSPRVYFPEIGDDELRRHLVPLDPDLRDAAAFPAFVRERRRLLATGITAFLDSFRPSWLAGGQAVEMPRDQLVINVYRDHADGDDGVVEFIARGAVGTWTGRCGFADLERFLTDLGDGLAASLAVGGDTATVAGGQETIEVPIGPFLVTGIIEDWRAMVVRELGQPMEPGVTPGPPSGPWTGERNPILVLDTQ